MIMNIYSLIWYVSVFYLKSIYCTVSHKYFDVIFISLHFTQTSRKSRRRNLQIFKTSDVCFMKTQKKTLTAE